MSITIINSMADICRVCLSVDRRMQAISNTVFQEIWERLTKAQFNANDGKPLFVCYICYAQLRNAQQLMQRASKAEELLTTVMNYDSDETRQTTLRTASLTHPFRYKYAIKEAYQLECKQFERSSMDEIKKEKEEGSAENNGERSEENNEEEIDIKIKEEDICQEENLDSADDESGITLDDTLLKMKLEKEVQIDVEKTDIGVLARKRTITEVPQKAKRIKLKQITKDRKLASDKSCSEHLSEDRNADSIQIMKTPTNSYEVGKTSEKVNIPRKRQAKNVSVRNNETLDFKDSDNAGKEISLINNAETVAPSSLDRDKFNISNRKGQAKYFLCDTCQYRCIRKSELIKHIRIHTGEKPFKCDECDYRCSRKSYLATHVKFKHIKEKNFSCHMCPFKFITKSELNRHLRKHTGNKPYECDLCDYQSLLKSDLNAHIKSEHTKKEKNHSCHICQCKFDNKSSFNRHLSKHTGDKPYKCDFCDYRCPLNSDLKSHMKFKHIKEKNFSCHMCAYKSVTRSDLNKHIRKHTGEKPYKCDLCEYRCSLKSNLNTHRKLKHNGEGIL